MPRRSAGLHEPIDPDSAFMKEWWASPKPVDPQFLRRQRRNAAGIPLQVWLAVLDQGLVDSDLQRTLPRLRAPTLLIWGSADPIMEPPVRRTLRRALPHAKVVIFPGSATTRSGRIRAPARPSSTTFWPLARRWRATRRPADSSGVGVLSRQLWGR